MAELITAVNELLKGRNPQNNLSIYTKGLFALYKRMAYLRFSMNYFTFGEVYADMDVIDKKEISDAVDTLQELVKAFFVDEKYDDLTIEKAWKFREQLFGYMETLTAYVDRFRIYEYMLNRVEFRFKKSSYSPDYYNGQFERDIEKYVLSDKDNSVINMKMSMIIGEVPMRLSQNKFFNILENSFSLYKGSEMNSVKDFAYMIETAGTIYKPEVLHKSFNVFAKIEKKLADADYENIDENSYDSLRIIFDEASALLEEYSDTFVMMAEVLNDICTMILAKTTLMDVKEKNELLNIINATYDAIEERNSINDQAETFFEKFEGYQEKLHKEMYTPDSALDEIYDINKDLIKTLGLENEFENLKKASKLQSASTFAALEPDVNGLKEADESFVKEQYDIVVNKFKNLFDNCTRLQRRAIMASVISGLPVFFNSFEEFKEYIHIALSQCTDEAEKAACMSLVGIMISGD